MQPEPSSQDKSDTDQQPRSLSRRSAIRILFFGGVLTAGASLAYRLGQILPRLSHWSLAREATSTPASQVAKATSPTTTLSTSMPATLVSTKPAEPSPGPTETREPVQSTSAMPTNTSGETIPATQRTTPEATLEIDVDGKIAKPEIISQKVWGGVGPAGRFIRQLPQRITLHHEGVLFDGSTPAPHYLRNVQHWSIAHQHWPDLPYHFLIDLEGRIYEGRPLDARGDTNTSYELQGHALIALLGKYDAGEQRPSQTQIDSIIALMAWIAESYSISPDTIRGHRDFIPLNDKGEHIDPRTHEHITCPGDNLYQYLADHTIQKRVRQILDRAQRFKRPFEKGEGERR